LSRMPMRLLRLAHLLISLISLLCILALTPAAAQPWTSALVAPDAEGRLVYTPDADGFVLPDFSHAGYRGGGLALPSVPTVVTVATGPGDDTERIQAAMDELGARPLGADGFRGAVELAAGTYDIAGQLWLRHAGVVLRGAGSGSDPSSNTVLRVTGNEPAQRIVLRVGGRRNSQWSAEVSGTRTAVTSDRIPVGARSFTVADASALDVGDTVILVHPSTQAWLDAIDGGGTAGDPPWAVGEEDVVFNRTVTALSGNRVTVDAPVFYTLDRSLSEAYVYVLDRADLVTHVGVERLRIDIQPGDDLEDHAWVGVQLVQVEDAWARDVAVVGYGSSAFRTRTATRVTIAESQALDPLAEITGERMYGFNLDTASQLVLVRDSYARNGRHHYATVGGANTSGSVFLDNRSEGALSASEPHRRWSSGILYDNHRELTDPPLDPRLLWLGNRGSFGDAHGWSAAHAVAWNVDLGSGVMLCQQPPTAQNYAIGVRAEAVVHEGPVVPFTAPACYEEGINRAGTLEPRSLYLAQLDERLRAVSTEAGPETAPLALAAFPNPVAEAATVRLTLPTASVTRVTVYDVLGRPVATLHDGLLTAGTHALSWMPERVGAGVYVLVAEAEGQRTTQQVSVVR
ncbi:MAG: T9SS type A sorting domain-containing protein, partial [Bacteroidota bacterium]